MTSLIERVIERMSDDYPELEENRDLSLEVIEREVIPFMEREYRVDPSYRVLAGNSYVLTGLFTSLRFRRVPSRRTRNTRKTRKRSPAAQIHVRSIRSPMPGTLAGLFTAEYAERAEGARNRKIRVLFGRRRRHTEGAGPVPRSPRVPR